ncbi:MAG: hypothetical protein WB661_09255 [Candidatus Bathyarchaeia archaeon]
MASERQLIPDMQPRDVLAPIATLLGLLAAALSFLAGAKLSVDLFQVLVDVIVVILLVFVVAAVLTTVAALSRSTFVWNVAIAVYAVSWIIFGIGFVAILLAFAYGPQVFSITIPQLGVTTNGVFPVFSVIASVLGVIASFIVYHTMNALRSLIASQYRLKSEQPQLAASIEKRANREVSRAGTAKLAFIDAYIELEKLLRRIALVNQIDVRATAGARELIQTLAAKGVVSKSLVPGFLDITQVRNMIVHGRDIPLETVRAALGAALHIKDQLWGFTRRRD